MESGLLYVVFNKWICNPETHEMPYKIGITKYSVSDRYYGLGLKMPGKFEIKFAYKLENYAEAEKALGTIFEKDNINGEWYNLDEDDLALIELNCKKMHGKLVTEEIESEIKKETESQIIKDDITLDYDKDIKPFFENNGFTMIHPKGKNCIYSRPHNKTNFVVISDKNGYKFKWETTYEKIGKIEKRYEQIKNIYPNAYIESGTRNPEWKRIWFPVNQSKPLEDSLDIIKNTIDIIGYKK
jgi:hypothetical protein